MEFLQVAVCSVLQGSASLFFIQILSHCKWHSGSMLSSSRLDIVCQSVYVKYLLKMELSWTIFYCDKYDKRKGGNGNRA